MVMRGPLLSALLHAALFGAALAFAVPGALHEPRGVTVKFALAEEEQAIVRDPLDPEPPPPVPLPDLAVAEAAPEVPEQVEFEITAEVASPEPPPALRVPGALLRKPLRLRTKPPETAPPPAAPKPLPAIVPKGPTRVASLLDRASITLEYPRLAQERGYEGRVLLRVRVGVDGTVKEVVVQESSGHAILDDAAVRMARDWTFEPALREGAAVESWFDQAVRFALRS